MSRQQSLTQSCHPMCRALSIFLLVLACLLNQACSFSDSVKDTTSSTTLTHTENDLQNDVFEKALRPTVLIPGQPAPQWSIQERMEHYNVPGVAVAILVDGNVKLVRGYGVLSANAEAPVTGDTVFSVGSVSKVVTAAVTLKLHEEDILDVDRPISSYLESWQIPETTIANSDNVTLRKIMSHTAGFSVHGFDDYMPDETIPKIVQILNGEPPAKSPPVQIILEPGTTFKYSGGGVTVEQIVLSDVLDKPFGSLSKEVLFDPIGMDRSTFENPISANHGNIAKAHDYSGNPAALPRGWPAMPEQAASGLWSSAKDLGIFVSDLLRTYRGADQFLQTSTVNDMMTPVGTGVGFSPRIDPSESGMGPRIDVSLGELTFNHPGANDHYRAWIEGNLETGNGLVILSNGANGNPLLTEIRNAVSDSFDWKTNPPVTLDYVEMSAEALSAFDTFYVGDTFYPTSMQRQLSAFENSKVVAGKVEDGILILEGGGTEIKLRMSPR